MFGDLEDPEKSRAQKAILEAFNRLWEHGESELIFKISTDEGRKQWKLEERKVRRGDI